MPVDTAALKAFEGKAVLVTGGTGMIGRQVVDILCEAGAKVTTVSLDPQGDPRALHIRGDLRDGAFCRMQTAGMGYVFHLAGLKGGAASMGQKGLDLALGMLLMDFNVLEASRLNGVPHLLYTSSIGAYAPSKFPLKETAAWDGWPMDLPGQAKRMAELVIAGYRREMWLLGYGAVRLAACYGPGDRFDVEGSMVIPSLLARVLRGDNPFIVAGNGSQVRDFIYSRDAAEGIVTVMTKLPSVFPIINIGTGQGCSIHAVAHAITEATGVPHAFSGPGAGYPVRVLDVSLARVLLGFEAETDLEEGIKKTWEWLTQP